MKMSNKGFKSKSSAMEVGKKYRVYLRAYEKEYGHAPTFKKGYQNPIHADEWFDD